MALPDWKIKEWVGGRLPDFRVAQVALDATPRPDFTYEIEAGPRLPDYTVQFVAESAVPRPDYRIALVEGGGGSYDAEATALFARMSVQPAVYLKQAISDLIVGARGAGWWAKMRGFHALNLHTEQAAYLNWIASGPYTALTAYTGYTYRPNFGWAGNGTSTTGGYLGTGINASSLLAQNDHAIFAHVRTAVNGGAVVGMASAATDRLRLTFKSGGTAAARLSDGTTLSAANAAASGLVVGTRTAADVKKVYVAGAEIATATTASLGQVASELCFARSGATRSSDEMTVVGFGLGLSAADVASMNSLIEAFIAATEPRFYTVTTSGQSNLNRQFIDNTSANVGDSGSGDGTAGSNAMNRVFRPALQAALDATYSDGRPNVITLVNKAVSGAAMLPTSGQNSWWDNVANGPAQYALDWQTAVLAIPARERGVHINCHAQGEHECSGAFLVGDWEAATRALFVWMRSTVSPQVKTVVQPLGRNSGIADSRMKSFRDAQQAWVGVVADFAMAPDTADIYRVNAGDWHAVSVDVSAEGYDRMALELARTVAVSLGCLAIWRGPEIAAVAASGANTVDVTLTWPNGGGGSDFTPTTGIQGFKVSDGSGARTITSAVRQASNVVRLTVSGAALSGAVTVTHDNMAGGLDRTKLIRDNAAGLAMPLRVSLPITAT